MKALVVSDTHGKLRGLEQLLQRYSPLVNTVIHLGDYCRDLLGLKASYPGLDMITVAGAMDFGHETIVERTAHGRKILMVHGHMHNVKESMSTLTNLAYRENANVCLFGHTHLQTMYEDEGILFMNPGSVTEPRASRIIGYGLLEISADGKLRAEVLPL
ncbi:MAG: YfcE family phosphodiesterase [Defluviitaleaceae bacterium]|nr:YfcE family phosphodiesterase [Defluviitaleaceae bacterium]